ncbi:MAG: acyl-CoA dehydrogenase family protein [Ramlibacter sp.]
MQFELNAEQKALQDSVARLLGRHYGFEQRRAIAAGAEGWSPDVWKELGNLGACSLLVPEAHEGFGGNAVDLLAVMPELGRTLSLEPFLASSVLASTALTAAPAGVRDALLPSASAGELLLAWAHDEPGARHAPLWVETAAQRDGEGWRLSGHKCNVLHGAVAQRLVVTARTKGEASGPEGLALFLVDTAAKGTQLTAHRLVDDSPAAEILFDGVHADLLCTDAEAIAAVERTQAMGIAAVCADALGAMEAAFALTTDYIRTRKQFGRTIGENQALRHRVAEMFVSLEMCRSMAMVAAVAASAESSADTRADLARAKLMVGRHGRSLCHAAIQLHGGIGMTEEYAVGHYLRRVTLIDQLFGDADAQAARLASMA